VKEAVSEMKALLEEYDDTVKEKLKQMKMVIQYLIKMVNQL
jgi:hypothetical protein